jgi:Rieske Fe-S protein
MDRRHFIKSTCHACLLGAAGFALPQMAGCSQAYHVFKTQVTDNRVTVPLSLFEKESLQLVRPSGWYYDIAVQKEGDNTYSALLMKCTHQDNQLSAGGNGFECPLHGSRFDKAGNVRKGPAELPLKKYTVTTDKDNLVINI